VIIDDVLEAMKQAKEQVDIKEEKVYSLNNDKNDESEVNNEQRNRFIQELVQAGQSKNLAERAFKHVDPEDYPEGLAILN
jgi:hypothetical protein